MKCTQCNNQADEGNETCCIKCGMEALRQANECLKEAAEELYGSDPRQREIELFNSSLFFSHLN